MSETQQQEAEEEEEEEEEEEKEGEQEEEEGFVLPSSVSKLPGWRHASTARFVHAILPRGPSRGVRPPAAGLGGWSGGVLPSLRSLWGSVPSAESLDARRPQAPRALRRVLQSPARPGERRRDDCGEGILNVRLPVGGGQKIQRRSPAVDRWIRSSATLMSIRPRRTLPARCKAKRGARL